MKSDEVRPILQDMAAAIDAHLTRHASGGRAAFMLIVWTDDMPEGEGAHYVSNAPREATIRSLRETADRLERRGDGESQN